MLLMYSILNWSSGLASGTGGIKVLIADTIVCKAQVWEKKKHNNNDTGIKQDNRKCNKQMLWACTIISQMELQTGFRVTTNALRRKWLRWNSPLLHPSRFSEYLGFSVSFLYMGTNRIWGCGYHRRLVMSKSMISGKVDSTDKKEQPNTGEVEDEGEWKHLWHGRLAASLFCDHKNATKTCHVLV